MTKTNIKTELGIIQYSDLSFHHENKLRLIATLLLQFNGNLEVNELREIGFQIISFLEKKALMDNLFWKRSIPKSLMSDERIILEMDIIKQELKQMETLL